MSTLISQTITTNGTWYPTKCALYIRVVGQATTSASDINGQLVLDSTNFANYSLGLIQSYYDDISVGYTGSGCLTTVSSSNLSVVDDLDSAAFSYPITLSTEGKEYIYLRVKGNGQFLVFVDGFEVASVTSTNSSWNWISTSIVIPDQFLHVITIKMMAVGLSFDKMVLSNVVALPSGNGPNYTGSGYVTLHCRMATSTAGQPNRYLNELAALNSITDIVKDSWYNFDTTLFPGFNVPSEDQICVVAVGVGASDTHYLVWDISDNYFEPSAVNANGLWVVDNTTSMSIQAFEDYTNDEYGCIISTPDATLEVLDTNNFAASDLNGVLDNTVYVEDILGNNAVELDTSEKLITLVFDQSGSQTWNDVNGLRNQFISEIVNVLEARYPSPIRYNAITVNGQPAFSWVVAVKTKQTDLTPATIIRAAIANQPTDVVGFRVLRNPDRFSNTPLDGEIVMDGFGYAAQDTKLNPNTQYYYTVYTYNQNNDYSVGIQIPVTTNSTIIAPRGLPTFSTTVYVGYDLLRNPNIIGQWNTDEGSGNYSFDFSDSALTLNLNNTRWLLEYDCPTGLYGLRFNGVTSSANTVSTSLMAFSSMDSFSVTGWIYPFGTDTNSCIISRSLSAFNWAITQQPELSLQFTMDGITYATSTSVLNIESWSHFAVVKTATTVSFYINGILSNTVNIAWSSVNISESSINLANDPSGTIPVHFFGKLSHISVHNIAYTSNEIASLSIPNQRFDPIYGNRIAPDNGDRLVVASFDVADDLNFTTVRVVRNDIRSPYFESDGSIVLEVPASAGQFIYSLPLDYDVDSISWFRCYTQNSFGNWSLSGDSTLDQTTIPDQERLPMIFNIDVPGEDVQSEINPGPGFGPVQSPTITQTQIGRGKNYISWEIPPDPATRIKIYYLSGTFPVYNASSQWIVDPSSSTPDELPPVFNAKASVGSFVHRDIPDGQAAFYIVVATDRLGRYSPLVQIGPLFPSNTANDTGIPLLEVTDVAYELLDYDMVEISWDSSIVITSSVGGYFSDSFYVYGGICDLYGNLLPIAFPNNFVITSSVGNVSQSSIQNIFATLSANNASVQSLPNTTFTVDSGGLMTGQVRLNGSSLFASLESLTISITSTYTYSAESTWELPTLSIVFENPLVMTLVNRDNLRFPTGQFVSTPCNNNLVSGGSDDTTGPTENVNGVYIRRVSPFTVRAIFTYKGNPVPSAIISARIIDATGGPCGISTNTTNQASTNVVFTQTSFPIQVGKIPIYDNNGYNTGTFHTVSYADLPIQSPYDPQSATVYVRVQNNVFQVVQEMNIFFPTILNMSLSASAPLGNGVDFREQFVRAWIIDPDYPNDETKINIAPDNTVVQWQANITGTSITETTIPFYSTDIVPLVNGVYSYTRSGTASLVYFGPTTTGGTFDIVASTTINDLFGSVLQTVQISTLGGSSNFQSQIPNPTLPRIFAEMPECINYLWADGVDYVKMQIFRNPTDPSKTLVQDSNGNMVQAKYADTFRSCSQVLLPLTIGTTVTINAQGYEIIDGTVVEEYDPVNNYNYLNTDNAIISQNTANIIFGPEFVRNIYFRQNSEVTPAPCMPIKATNCCGFDMTNQVCDGTTVIGLPTGVVINANVNFEGQPTMIYGGGGIGDDATARPPCVLVPKEPLLFKFIGVFVNNSLVNKVVVDGITQNQFLFEISYSGNPVPAGVPISILLIVVINGAEVTAISGVDIYTYFNVPKTVFTYNTTNFPGFSSDASSSSDTSSSSSGGPQIYSICGFIMNPIPTTYNIAIGIGAETTYNGSLDLQTSSSSSGGV